MEVLAIIICFNFERSVKQFDKTVGQHFLKVIEGHMQKARKSAQQQQQGVDLKRLEFQGQILHYFK